MFYCAHDPGFAAFLSPEYGVQDSDPLRTRDEDCGATEQCFVSRATYGRYLESLVAPWRDDRLRCASGWIRPPARG
ncbi:MAG: hypothetical protein IBX58_05910 [Roseovarius sp.]|nr:hypothetical protein [Roseovarius sp.]